jgi:pSer/pThr/pTyr-binding forkhead associated (FHA) protein
MAMDVLERLNRKFGVWYEGLFGGGEGRDLRPRDILRRILAAMEDGRREGLDGQVYVPNVYTLQIAVENDDERHYLRTFLNAEDLAAAVARAAEQHGYQVRGPLVFTVEEKKASAFAGADDRVTIQCRFDAAAAAAPPPPSTVETVPEPDEEEEPGTIASVPTQTLASLVVRGEDGRLQDVYPLTARGARVGRGRHVGNDIILNGDGMISKTHARFAFDGSVAVLYDENSTNGTFLRGERIASGQPYPLQAGDEVRVGQTLLLYRPAAGSVPAPLAAPPPVETRSPVSGFRLVAGDGETHALATQMTVGRALTSDIVVIGNGVASQHARLSLRGDSYFVEDLGTAGGTVVNGERIPAGFPVALYDGDQIAFGEVLFRLTRGASR